MKKLNGLIGFFLAISVCLGSQTFQKASATTSQLLSFSRSGSNNSYTSGYTLVKNLKDATGYLQDNSTNQEYKIGLYKNTNILANTPTSVQLNCKIGGGTGNKDLTTPIYASFLDTSGNKTGTEVNVTSKITTAAGDDYSIDMNLTNISSVGGVIIYHTKTASYNVRFYSFSLSYTYGDSGSGNAGGAEQETTAVTGVTLNKNSASLYRHETTSLSATVAPSNATTQTVTWSSSNESVATVENGIVTAIGPGNASIVVTTTDGSKTATCNVTVNDYPSYDGLEVDSQYVMAATKDTSTYEMNGVLNNNIIEASSYTDNPAGLYPLTIRNGIYTNSFSFKNDTNYLNLKANNNYLNTSTSITENSSWFIEYQNNECFIRNVAYPKRYLKFNYNSGNARFSSYESTFTSGINPSFVAYSGTAIPNATHAGTLEDPYTIAEACDVQDGLLNGNKTNIYVKGYVTKLYNTPIVGNSSYYIDDTVEGSRSKFELFKVSDLLNQESVDTISVGDLVVACGNLTKYNSTYELAAGCTIVSNSSAFNVLYNTNGGSFAASSYSTFVANDGATILPNPLDEDDKIVYPTKDGYVFCGWYSDSNFVNKFVHNNDAVTSQLVSNNTLTLYAKWASNSDNLASLQNIENSQTKASLSFSYTLNEGNYTINSMSMRFGGLVRKSDFNNDNIVKYGVLLASNAKLKLLGCDNLDELLYTFDYKLDDLLADEYGNSVVDVRATVTHPYLSNATGTAAGEDYYLWNAKVTVPSANYNDDVNAIAYVMTGDGYCYRLQEKQVSAKTLAHTYQNMDLSSYSEEIRGAIAALDSYGNN